MSDEILSNLRTAPTSRFIYSSLSFYGPELSGSWFTRALTAIGIDETAVRQTLYRMERDGVLTARKVGRTKIYSPAPTSQAIIAAGTSKMLDEPEGEWDGAWTLVRFRFDNESRELRDQIRDLLNTEGFAALGSGLYIHPRDRSARIAALRLGAAIQIFRGPRLHPEVDDRRFARELWDLDGIAERYREFIDRFGGLARRTRWKPADAAAMRFATVFAFLEVAWDDPELPAELLPARWPGHRARAIVRELYTSLAPQAREFGAAITRSTAAGSSRAPS